MRPAGAFSSCDAASAISQIRPVLVPAVGRVIPFLASFTTGTFTTGVSVSGAFVVCSLLFDIVLPLPVIKKKISLTVYPN